MLGSEPENDGYILSDDQPVGDPSPAITSDTDPADWPQIAGYRISGCLGSGGMGTVYKAFQLSTNRDVALKVMRGDVSQILRSRALFTQEVRLAARLQHPNVVRIYDSGIDCGLYYYAMELVVGETLDQYALVPHYHPSGEVHHRPILPRRQILQLMQQVCRCVHEAHLRGVIHRDLKPRNIMVTNDGQPHVLDFGLATAALQERIDETFESSDPPVPHLRIAGNDPSFDTGLATTHSRHIAGTPAFMSPEQSNGRPDNLDYRTDVFSLGVTLYLLLTGRMPRDVTGGRTTVIRKVAQEPIVPPRQFDPSIDRELEAMVLKSLAFDRTQRYASSGEMADDLGRYLAGRPVLAVANTPAYVLRKWMVRHRRPLMLATCVALAVGGLSGYSLLSHRALQNTQAESSEYDQALKQIITGFSPQVVGRQIGDRDRLNQFADYAGHLFHDRPAQLAGELDLIGVALMDLGWCRDAEKHLQMARNLQTADENSLDSIRLINDLAAVKRELGQSAASAQLSQHAITIAKQIPGSENQCLRAMMEWAYALDDQGRPDDAFAAATRAVEMSHALHPDSPRHPDILRAKNTLAIALRDQGKIDQARELVEEVLAAREVESGAGPTHPDTIRSMDLHATILGLAGDSQRAMAEIDRAIDLSAAALRVDHADRLRFENDRGTLFCQQGRFSDAAKCLNDALEKSSQQADEEDLSTISLMGSQAANFCAWADQLQKSDSSPRERHDIRMKAQQLLTRVVKLLNEPPGTDDPTLLRFKDALAAVECAQGEYPQAQNLYEYVLHLQEKRFGENDPALAGPIRNQADVLRFQGKWQLAEAQYYRLWKLEIASQGRAGPATLAALNDLNFVRQQQKEMPQ